jgi:GTP-sensing pleiotropic transcriptional regulator CodY
MYIRKLMEIFQICEERGNTEGLRMMFKVVKGLSKSKLAHVSKILEKIDWDDTALCLKLLAALEFEPLWWSWL